MGQTEQQALAAKQQQAGDHRVAPPPPPPTAFHQEIQQHQQARPQQQTQPEARPVQERRPPQQIGQNDQGEQLRIQALQKQQAIENQRLAAQQAEISRVQHQQQIDQQAERQRQITEAQQNQIRQTQHPGNTGRPVPLGTNPVEHQVGVRPIIGVPPTGHPIQTGQPPEGRQPYPDNRQPPRGQYPPSDGQGYGFNPNRPPNFGDWGQHDHERLVFVPVIPFGPPRGEQWGWQNPGQWNRGYDSSFFQQDPNYEHWQPTISQESQNVSQLLNSGDTQGAATTLNNDLWAMRGDIYGQNELLHEVQNEQTGEGAQLYLGQWDPTRGSWDAIEVQSPAPPPGYDPDPSFNLRTFE